MHTGDSSAFEVAWVLLSELSGLAAPYILNHLIVHFYGIEEVGQIAVIQVMH